MAYFYLFFENKIKSFHFEKNLQVGRVNRVFKKINFFLFFVQTNCFDLPTKKWFVVGQMSSLCKKQNLFKKEKGF